MQFQAATLALGSIASFFLAPTSALAGIVLVVDDTPGPGVQYSDIQPAVAAASDGDLILVKGGVYSGFTIQNQSLSVIGDFGQSVEVVGNVVIDSLSATHRVLLRGLSVSTPVTNPILLDPNFDYTIGVHVGNSQGIAWIEDCSIDGFFTGFLATAANANLIRLSITPRSATWLSGYYTTGDALIAQNSSLTVDDCTLLGGMGADTDVQGGDGCRLTDTHAYFVGSTIKGGSGKAAVQPIFGQICNSAGPGGDALVLIGASTTARNVASSIVAGAGGTPSGGSHPTCVAGAPGHAVVFQGGTYIVDPLATPRALTVSAPKRVGEVVTFTIQGATGDQVFLFWGATPLQTFFPIYSHSLMVAPAVLVPVVTMPGPTFQFNAIMGPIVSGQLSQVIYAQLAIVDTQNDIILSGPSTIIALDPSL